MEKFLGANWKTTLTGFVAAIWFAVQPIIAKGDFEISRDYRSLIYAAIFAVMGLVTKDHDITGGTTGNKPNDASIVKDTTQKDA